VCVCVCESMCICGVYTGHLREIDPTGSCIKSMGGGALTAVGRA